MSRCYRISINESLRRHIEVDDGVEIPLELLDILPPERMIELLGAELTARGYTAKDGRYSKVFPGNIEVTLDPAEGVVAVGTSTSAELELSESLSRTVVEEAEEAQTAELRAAATERLRRRAEEAQQSLRSALTTQLEESLAEIRSEIDQAINRATAEALKEKARQLGDVQEIHEDPDTGALTIRVRV